jgi:hypothetical protein
MFWPSLIHDKPVTEQTTKRLHSKSYKNLMKNLALKTADFNNKNVPHGYIPIPDY